MISSIVRSALGPTIIAHKDTVWLVFGLYSSHHLLNHVKDGCDHSQFVLKVLVLLLGL